MNKIKYVTIVSTLLLSSTLSAKDFSLTLGSGYPFLTKVEFSVPQGNQQNRLFANYKVGLDDGFSAGFEHAIDNQQQHAFGIVIGAIGARDGDGTCGEKNPLEGSLCDIFDVFDNDTTNGLAGRYSFNVNGLNNSGLVIAIELGYGRASHLKQSRVDGGISVSYRF